ncbi:hypothetical protein E0686_10050 [Deinococcus sp. S9]|nr:hypothetical protein E0686_10050 [Deinococcus sp. S9]
MAGRGGPGLRLRGDGGRRRQRHHFRLGTAAACARQCRSGESSTCHNGRLHLHGTPAARNGRDGQGTAHGRGRDHRGRNGLGKTRSRSRRGGGRGRRRRRGRAVRVKGKRPERIHAGEGCQGRVGVDAAGGGWCIGGGSSWGAGLWGAVRR